MPTTRTKKIAVTETSEPLFTEKPATQISKVPLFTQLTDQIRQLQDDYNALLKQIADTKDNWIREQETYDYENKRTHKQAEDEFTDRRVLWEKQLTEQRQAIELERKEVAELRKTVAVFPDEKDKAIKQAVIDTQKQITEKYDFDKKLSSQEHKSEIDLLHLKISNLTADNSRLQTELEIAKKTLTETNQQVKDIAVRVIDSHKPQQIETTPKI